MNNNQNTMLADIYPMSSLQLGMVVHSQIVETMFHDVFSYHIKTHWQRECFEQALQYLIDCHPVLRSGFDLQNSRPMQLVYQNVPLPLSVEDISAKDATTQENMLDKWLVEERHKQFNWKQAPFFHLYIHLRSKETLQLSISFHHAILDGWSVELFKAALFEVYAEQLKGEGLPEVKVNWSFRECIRLELAALKNQPSIDFWQQQLASIPERQIPVKLEHADSVHIETESYHCVSFTACSGQLLRLAKQFGTQIQHLLLALQLKTLATYSGNQSASTYVVSNIRPEIPESEEGIGMFLNSMPLSLQFGEQNWQQLVSDVADIQTSQLQHRHFPLSSLIDKNSNEVLFNYTNLKVDLDSNEHNSVLLGVKHFEQINFDLYFDFARTPGQETIAFTLKYNAKLYERYFIEQLCDYFVTAAKELLAKPQQGHSDVAILSKDSEHLLQRFAQSCQNESCLALYRQFELQAAQNPQNTALVFDDEQLSYEQVNCRANQLAHMLKLNGVGPDVLVGVCLERSLELVVALMAIWKAGGAYVPLDPNYPAERLSYMIKDSRLKLLITQTGLKGEFSQEVQIRCLCVDDDVSPTALSYFAQTNLTGACKPEHLAYVIYTSGSTGLPKGTMVEHRNIANFHQAMKGVIGEKVNVMLALTSVSFDISVLELLCPLVDGSTVVIAPDIRQWQQQTTKNDNAVASLIANYQVNQMQCTPTVLAHLMDDIETREGLKALEILLVGGEALAKGLADEVCALGNVKLHNMYGPTETTIWSSSCEINADDSQVFIGQPLLNNRFYILDHHHQRCPVGVIGRLFIGGEGVCRGYLNRPELTAERFIKNSFDDNDQHPLYDTGDLVRLNEQGQLVFVGRSDSQVKLRGHRIELGEIEQQICGSDWIEQAVAKVQTDVAGNETIVVFVRKAAHVADGSSQRLRDELAKRLPKIMLPSHFEWLEAFPTTPNGKIDRGALKAEFFAPSVVTQSKYVAPITKTQERVCEIWQSLLGQEAISIKDHFINLGGHSLLVVRMIAMLSETFEIEIPASEIFAAPTIESIAALIDAFNFQASMNKSEFEQHKITEEFVI